MKEKAGAGEVVVVSLGGAGVQTTLRNALALGADRALHLKRDARSPDGLAVARALAAAIQPLGASIVWLGKQAVDDDAAQVGPDAGDAARTAVRHRDRDVRTRRASTAKVEREIEGGREAGRGAAAGRAHHRQGPERAALRLAQGHHGGEEEADRGAPRPSCGAPHLEVVSLSNCRPRAPRAGSWARAPRRCPSSCALLRDEAKVI